MNLKIVTLAPLPPTTTGGVEEYAYSLANAMDNKGLYLTIVTSKSKGQDMFYPLQNKKFIYIPSFNFYDRPFPKSIRVFLKVTMAIRESDVVHIHMSYPFLEASATLIAKLFGKKVIVTYHADARIDADPETEKKKPIIHTLIEKAYLWISAKWALRFCDVVCTNTMGYARTSPVLSRYLNKVKIIHQGIRKELYDYFDQARSQEIRARHLSQNYTHLVTFVGRLVPYKGLPYLIEAVHRLSIETDKKILFMIGGNGPQKEHLIDMVRKYNLENVVFLGYVKDDELLNLFAASDLVVSPSISNLESTPISLLSALAVGTPVIGTFVGGTEETVPNDGFAGAVIPARNPQILASTINSMLENNCNIIQSAEMKLMAGSASRRRFWSDVANDYLQLINMLVRDNGKYTVQIITKE